MRISLRVGSVLDPRGSFDATIEGVIGPERMLGILPAPDWDAWRADFSNAFNAGSAVCSASVFTTAGS